jgi:hypothetical protein
VSQTKSTEKFFWKKSFREIDAESSVLIEDSVEALEETNSSQGSPKQLTSVTMRARPNSRSSIASETKLIIGIPAHNSQRTIATTAVILKSLEADIVVCDDHSTDATEEIARAIGCKIVRHPRELGVSDSITSIFIAARRLHATCLLTVDPEISFVLRDALNLIQKVQSGECDIAIGSERSMDDEAPSEETIDGVRDPFSVFRAYGRRALALIAPAGTTSVVLESDILPFAKQQGLRVKEYKTSSAPLERNVESKTMSQKLESAATAVEGRLSKLSSLAALKHPLLFFGIPSVAMLLASVVQAAITIQSWGANGIRAEFGFYYAGYDLVISLILGVGALILESQRTNSEKDRWRKQGAMSI